MIISRTPLRISFVGGGSDLPAFYRNRPGAVVSTSINKYVFITATHRFDRQICAKYSITETVNDVNELKHELIREALYMVGLKDSIEITSISDVPSQGTGLGSSSTYTVGLLNALYTYIGRSVDAEQLAREASAIEIERCGKPVGKQDQYIAAYGGFQFIQFNPDESVFVEPITCSPLVKDTLQERLIMLYTGMARSANGVLEEQRDNVEKDHRYRQTLQSMTQLAQDLKESLCRGDIDVFGDILHENWKLKQSLATGISNPRINYWYERARRYGAIGGKVLGAGGGGFLLLYAPVEKHEQIKASLPELQYAPFRFEPQGSKILHAQESVAPSAHCRRSCIE